MWGAVGLIGLFLGSAANQAGALETAAASELRFELRAAKSSFVLYEPVVLDLVVSNPTQREIASLAHTGPTTGFARLWIEHEGEMSPFHSGLHLDQPAKIVVYKEGGVRSWSVTIFYNASVGELGFARVGQYVVHSRMFVGKDSGPLWIEAEPLRITVVEPGPDEQHLIDALGSARELIRLVEGGSSRYCRSEAQVECFGRIEALVDSRPGAAYSPAIAFDLASAVYSGSIDVGARYETAERVAKKILDRWPGHPVACAAMQLRILSLHEAGRTAEAERLLDEFESKYPGRAEEVTFVRGRLAKEGSH